MGERRGLIISSQCRALDRLDFLPQVGADLRDVLMAHDLGGCVAALPDRTAPDVSRGLLTDPGVADVKHLVREAFRLASQDEATLFLAYIGHAVERDDELFLQPFDAAPAPNDDTGVPFGRLIYQAIRDNPRVDGIVVLLDACHAGVGIQDAGRTWVRAAGQNGGRLEVVSATSTDDAYDGAFSRAVTELIRDGDSALGGTIRCADARQRAEQRCFPRQRPWWLGFTAGRATEHGDEGLWLGRNPAHRQDSSLLRTTAAYPQIERLTERFQSTPQVGQVVAATLRDRCVALVGDPGLGKSTLAAALARPDVAADVPDRFVHAFVTLGETDTPGQVARTIAQQFAVTVPGFDGVARDFEATQQPADVDVGDPLVRRVGGPLRLLDRPEPVRVVLDGVDQLPRDVVEELLVSTSRLVDDPGTALRVLLTVRPGVPLPRGVQPFPVRPATDAEIAHYLAERNVAAELRAEIVRRAEGRWLLARLCADIGDVEPAEPVSLSALYDRHIRWVTEQQAANADWLRVAVPIVLAVLAAAGTGPVLPVELLRRAAGALGGPGELARLHDVLQVLGWLVVRSHPGSAGEHVGLFHQTLVDHIRDEPAARVRVAGAHRALLDAIEASAPAGAVDLLSDAGRYAAVAEVEHLWALGRYDDAADSVDARPAMTARELRERLRRWHNRAVTELGPAHPATRRIARLIAAHNLKRGDRAEALRQFERIFADYQRTRGPRDKETLRTWSKLAAEVAESGAVQDGLREYEAIIPVQEEVLGRDHPDVYTTRYHMALWTERSGDRERAVRLLAELIDDQSRVLERHHPLVVQNRVSLAQWTGRLHGAAAAVDVLTDAVRDAEEHLDPDHEQTLRARRELTRWQRRLPRRKTPAAALSSADNVSSAGRHHPTGAWRRLLTDPDTVAAEYDAVGDALARAADAHRTGDIDSMVESLHGAATRAAATWSPDDYRTLELRFTLARALLQAGRDDAAYLMAQWTSAAAGVAWPRAEWKPLRQDVHEFKNACGRRGARRLRLVEVDTARTHLRELSPQALASFDEARAQRAARRYPAAVDLLSAVAAEAVGTLGARHPLALDLRFTVATWTGRYLSWPDGLRLLDETFQDAWQFVVAGGELAGGGKVTAATTGVPSVPVATATDEPDAEPRARARGRRGRRGGRKVKKHGRLELPPLDDDEFQRAYRNHVSSTMDELRLLPDRRSPIPADLGWMRLSLSEAATREGRRRILGRQWYGLDQRLTRIDPLPVDRALDVFPRRLPRLLVRGAPGSGKTTLVDWLAVTAARRGFTGPLADWNGVTPFPVRLRRYADAPLPTPERLVPDDLVERAPDGWVRRPLASGSALVLVDGVDEVPTAGQSAVRDWLAQLVTDFPGIRVVVTARDTAVPRQWLDDSDFTSLLVEPMGREQVRDFVRDWYTAAGTAPDSPVAQRLLDHPDLMSLADDPLRCSLLCALNLTAGTELPRGRTALCRAALDLFVGDDDAVATILRTLAWQLVQADDTALDRPTAAKHVAAALRGRAEAETPLDTLLERAGVLRGAASGPVDFVHDMFVPYVAADAAIAHGDLDVLVGNAHLDTWRETITTACALARPDQARQLVRGVLDRIGVRSRDAPNLWSVVDGCLAAVGDLDPDTRARLDRVIAGNVVPATRAAAAGSLDGVGRRLLRRLPVHVGDLSDGDAAAAVRVAGRGGDVDALRLLAGYAADPREAVQRELIRCWQYFDPERYARDVLADAPLLDGRITVPLLRAVPHVRHLRAANRVRVRLPEAEPIGDLRMFADVPQLIEITAWCTGTADLAGVADHPTLAALSLYGGSGYTGLGAVWHVPGLERLWLQPYDESAFADIGFVGGLTGTTSLFLTQLQRIDDYRPLRSLGGLTTLGLAQAPGIEGVGPIRHLAGLTWLNLNETKVSELDEFVTAFPKLTHLYVERTAVADLTPLAQAPLVGLSIQGCPVRDLRPLAGKNMALYLSADQDYDGIETLGPDVKITYV